MADPGALTAIALVALAYYSGASRWRARAGRPMVTRSQQLAFTAGLVVTAVAVASPLDGLADRSLTAHMVQHVILLSASSPLFALGAPLPTLLWAVPAGQRRQVLAASRWLTRHHDRWQVGWVAGSIAVEAGVIGAWHLPVLYEAALRHAAIHDLEHVSFVLTSTASWWTVVTGRRSRRGAAAVAALIGSLTGIVIGSAMVIAPRPFYPSYVRSTEAAALDDQRMAGVVMWAFGGLLEDITGAALFASWLGLSAEPPDDSYVVPPLSGAPR